MNNEIPRECQNSRTDVDDTSPINRICIRRDFIIFILRLARRGIHLQIALLISNTIINFTTFNLSLKSLTRGRKRRTRSGRIERGRFHRSRGRGKRTTFNRVSISRKFKGLTDQPDIYSLPNIYLSSLSYFSHSPADTVRMCSISPLLPFL